MRGYRLKLEGGGPELRVQKSSKCRTSSPLAHGVMDIITFQVLTCDNMCIILPSRDAHPSLESRIFIGAPSCKYDWPPLRLISVSGCSGGWADTIWPIASTLNHTVKLSGVTQASRKTKIYQAWNSKGLEITSQKPRAKSRFLLLHKAFLILLRHLGGQTSIDPLHREDNVFFSSSETLTQTLVDFALEWQRD